MFELGAKQVEVAYLYKVNSLVDPSAKQLLDLNKAGVNSAWQSIFVGYNTPPKDIFKKNKDNTGANGKKLETKTAVQGKSQLNAYSLSMNRAAFSNSGSSDTSISFSPLELIRFDSMAAFQLQFKHRRIKRTGGTSGSTEFRVLNYGLGLGFSKHQLQMALPRGETGRDSAYSHTFNTFAFALGLDYIPSLIDVDSWNLIQRFKNDPNNPGERTLGGMFFALRPQVRFLMIDGDSARLSQFLGHPEPFTIQWMVQPSLTLDFTVENLSFFCRFSRAWLLPETGVSLKGLTDRLDFTLGISLAGTNPINLTQNLKDRYNRLKKN